LIGHAAISTWFTRSVNERTDAELETDSSNPERAEQLVDRSIDAWAKTGCGAGVEGRS
jgi:hypothetical protein